MLLFLDAVMSLIEHVLKILIKLIKEWFLYNF